jgi:hypothetical protein
LPYLSEFETLWKEFDPNKTWYICIS